jgi:hypothetical protein
MPNAAARPSKSGNALKPLLPSCFRKELVAELIALGMGTTEEISEELNG